MKFIFFGSSSISVDSLNELKNSGFLPCLVITKPDSPQGRGLEIKPSVVKVWAKENNIKVITPTSLKDESLISELKAESSQLAVLVSYGKIIPQTIIDIFPKGILNLHPSLLPLLRGPSPIEYTILNDLKDDVGVSVMLLDSGMDTGPVLEQERILLNSWPISKTELYKILSKNGAKLLTETLKKHSKGETKERAQENSKATYSKMIKKEDGEINLEDDAYKNYLKFLAYEGWPGTFFFKEENDKKIRIKIVHAKYENGAFIPLRVIPEGKKEMDWNQN